MQHGPKPWGALSLAFLLGCGASAPSTRAATSPTAEGALPVAAGARLYFESDDPLAPHELTVAVEGTGASFAWSLGCGHVEPARALASPVTGRVDADTLASGRDVDALDRCDRVAEHDASSLPAFLFSERTFAALGRHERTVVRMASHATGVALAPVAHETVSIRVDGRPTDVDTVHARGGGVDVWIAATGTPLVVREVDHDRGFTLAGIDTAGARTPRAR